MKYFYLVTICKPCHDKLHKKKNAQTHSLKLKPKPINTKHATEVGIVAAQLRKHFGDFEETFGFITKIDRMEQGLEKRHFIDAAVIASRGKQASLIDTISVRRYIAKGDYQQTKGIRSEKAIPTGKLFGLRKFDLIYTLKGVGFIKGKRSSGYFSIGNIHGQAIHNSVKVKTDITRLSARNTTLTAMETFDSTNRCSPQGISIPPGPKETRFPGDS